MKKLIILLTCLFISLSSMGALSISPLYVKVGNGKALIPNSRLLIESDYFTIKGEDNIVKCKIFSSQSTDTGILLKGIFTENGISNICTIQLDNSPSTYILIDCCCFESDGKSIMWRFFFIGLRSNIKNL